MNTIEIFDVIQSKTAAFQDEGNQVYLLLEAEIVQGHRTVLSFVGIENCSTLFLNASIGRLYKKFPQNQIEALLTYDGIEAGSYLGSMLNRVIERSLNPQAYSAIISSALEIA
ncbi:STAS-like domain-containing protein [Dyadobacter sp. CY323]|uniref:STAS-like domain-containing protein n=1 Tax=Dyadobacter sp. CY323 TaxID=2907302 RepID=UPI001F3EBE90|nr:STAS-like domain-containing protein [Dyadobacter sp. CY323]MCE6989022.1 STAS-like domain-containing protein [Dyadobacter sp. CY323]